jgi:hypothetical protein
MGQAGHPPIVPDWQPVTNTGCAPPRRCPFPGAASPDLAPYVSKNGPERERYSDTDASWGHRSAVSTRKGGGFYGYRIHASVCTATDLPVAWTVATAREHESLFVAGLLDTVKARGGPRRARSKGL